MADDPNFRKPHSDNSDDPRPDASLADAPISKQARQDIAHDRGRICKKRGCVVCAPLVERRRLKKKEPRAEAQALAHKKGRPCGRSSCKLPVCVEALQAAAAPPPAEPTTAPLEAKDPSADLDLARLRQAKKHRLGLPCGTEDCPHQECIEGFANERKRRHRANRPCRSTTCNTAICVAAHAEH